MSPTLHVNQKPLSRTEKLRNRLNQLNALIGRLGHGSSQACFEILALFDEIQVSYSELAQEGHELRVEKALFDETCAGLQKKTRIFLQEIGGARKLREARAEKHPSEDRWWWHLDEWQAGRNRRMLRRIFIQVIVVIGVLSILWLLYQRFFAPDEETLARLNYQQRAVESVSQGDLRTALDAVEKGLEIAPQDGEILLLKGVILKQLQRSEEAVQTFAEAESTFDDRVAFLENRAQTYNTLGMPEAALEDMQELLQLKPDSARGHLLLGEAYEMLGRYTEAIEAYERVSQLAQDSDTGLIVLARIRMGMLLQAPPLPTE